MKSLLENLPETAPGREVFENLIARPCARVEIERIVSGELGETDGQWYDQNWDECVLLLAGEAVLEYADGTTATLKPFDFLEIPPNTPHHVKRTRAGTVWLALHFHDK